MSVLSNTAIFDLLEDEDFYINLILNIADSVDLILPEFLASGDAIFSSEPIINWARDVAVGNMNYNPIKLVYQIVLRDRED
ncbi:22170_t:CDS:2 [Dentiscutata erythropus]|uniref:22170_t:CDS:1 n=1 Tax=Dentiscutata erythropus TaxID=1348616 RepID=A0A9N9C9L2_9GLOM|nr:22170_t:CDS:2 [Dentiscutata erythropus]